MRSLVILAIMLPLGLGSCGGDRPVLPIVGSWTFSPKGTAALQVQITEPREEQWSQETRTMMLLKVEDSLGKCSGGARVSEDGSFTAEFDYVPRADAGSRRSSGVPAWWARGKYKVLGTWTADGRIRVQCEVHGTEASSWSGVWEGSGTFAKDGDTYRAKFTENARYSEAVIGIRGSRLELTVPHSSVPPLAFDRK